MALYPLYHWNWGPLLSKHAEISKLLLFESKKGNDLIMAEEEDKLNNLLFSKTWAFKKLKRNEANSKNLCYLGGNYQKGKIVSAEKKK